MPANIPRGCLVEKQVFCVGEWGPLLSLVMNVWQISSHKGMINPRSWYKGADTTSLLIYLEARFEKECADDSLEAGVLRYFINIRDMIISANKFMRTLYHCSFWLSAGERDALLLSGREAARLFKVCANHAYQEGHTRWKLQPKFHMLGEILFELQLDKNLGRESVSPLAWSTQMDEDLVGDIASASRSVSIRTLHERTLGRYKLKLAIHWGKAPGSPVSL